MMYEIRCKILAVSKGSTLELVVLVSFGYFLLKILITSSNNDVILISFGI